MSLCSIGLGKFGWMNRPAGLTGEDRKKHDAAVKHFGEAGDSGKHIMEWINSLTDEEQDELDRLQKEQDKIEDEMAAYGCYGKSEQTKPRPECCILVNGTSFCSECDACELNQRHLKAEAAVANFNTNHGVNFCGECDHCNNACPGFCDIDFSFHYPDEKKCKHFKFISDEGKNLDLMDEESLTAEQQKSRSDVYHREAAKNFAASLSGNLKLISILLKATPDYYERMYAEFPDVFKATNYKDFKSLWLACFPDSTKFSK